MEGRGVFAASGQEVEDLVTSRKLPGPDAVSIDCSG